MLDDLPGIAACVAAAVMLALATRYAEAVTLALGWIWT